MANKLDPKFTLSIAPPSEIEEVFRCLARAFKKDDLFQAALGKCDPEDIHQFFMKNLAPRWCFPDISIYKISEVATGYV